MMKFKFKGFTSLLLACCFLVASISGIVLFVTPQGRVANWTNWTMLGLNKHTWAAVHTNACLLVLIVSIVHLVLNWKVFWSYIKQRAAGLNLKLEIASALLITLTVVAGTVFQVRPFSSTTALNEKIKAYWEQQAPTGPAPHAEEFSVTRLASTIGLSVEEVATALEKDGFVVEDPDLSIGRLATQKGVAPSDVFAAIQRQFPKSAHDLTLQAGSGRGAGGGMGRGMGRGRGAGMGGGHWRQSAADTVNHLTTVDQEGDYESPGAGPGQGEGRICRQAAGVDRDTEDQPAHTQD